MAKEKTKLVNMRIPLSLVEEFDKEVEEDNLVTSRTGKIMQLMGKYIDERKKKRDGK
jgi:metal-responsive CopG/Arc/MetJ family transcriptional regulator